jgi:hypothetical protein
MLLMVRESSNGGGMTKSKYHIALHLRKLGFEMVMFNVAVHLAQGLPQNSLSAKKLRKVKTFLSSLATATK